MKRDLDLYRTLLKYFESLPAGNWATEIPDEGFGCSPAEFVEHLELLIEQGLVRGSAEPYFHWPSGGNFEIERLTAAGHDFLAASRDDEVWGVTKKRMKEVGSWTFSLIVEILKEEAKNRFGVLISGGK